MTLVTDAEPVAPPHTEGVVAVAKTKLELALITTVVEEEQPEASVTVTV